MFGVLTIAVRIYHDRWGYGVYSGPIGTAVLVITVKWVCREEHRAGILQDVHGGEGAEPCAEGSDLCQWFPPQGPALAAQAITVIKQHFFNPSRKQADSLCDKRQIRSV